MRITRKKLRHLVVEERATAKAYKKYGFNLQSKQEAKHSKFFANLLRTKIR